MEGHAFTLAVGERTHHVDGRDKAVRRARELSGNTWRQVELTRDDDRVHMTYKRGQLATYTFHTRDRKRRLA